MIDRPVPFVIFVLILRVIGLHARALIKGGRALKPEEDHGLHDTQTR